jgi:lysophospholipase L1-like esterase
MIKFPVWHRALNVNKGNMYRFQVCAQVAAGETIGLVGAIPQLGQWNVERCVRLQTRSDRAPLWWADIHLNVQPAPELVTTQVEYKYVCLSPDGSVTWEAWGDNRWIPISLDPLPSTVVVEDGWFGHVHPWPYGYFEKPINKPVPAQGAHGAKVVIIGSSVALGCSAWLLEGWAGQLEQALFQHYGHHMVNVSALGANVSTTIDRFPQVVAPQRPDIVVVALSLGNEGLAHCAPHERRAVQRRFESGLQQLVKMIRELGARPILGGVYPNGDYSPDHYWLLQDTHQRMLSWGVPVLDWLAVLGDSNGHWQPGLGFDAAHPNTEGHRLMYEAIDLSLFQLDKTKRASHKKRPQQHEEVPIYHDGQGFHIFACKDETYLRVINTSTHTYTIRPDWQELQTLLQQNAGLIPGIYVAKKAQQGVHPSFSVQADGTIETALDIPPTSDLCYGSAFNLFSPHQSQILFYDGHLGLLKEDEQHLRIINESDHEYNVHPMWTEIRSALKTMMSGVYEDVLHPETPFRSLMVGHEGLESRVKVPLKSSVLFQYRCKLSDLERVAIVPLGDRCAARMLLYKMEYDGPAFPFDLTRTTNLSDVADIIATGFSDMWNPALLHYDPVAHRIYHTKWSGLSFAHEVEDTDQPTQDMTPIYERMRVRYTARSERFWYTVQSCDRVLFVRTGLTNCDQVSDLMAKLELICQGKPFQLLLISLQPSDEFLDLPNVRHYNLEFNPDRMYEELDYWLHCTGVMQGILESLGVSSKNLFWCPPNPPKIAVLGAKI